MSPTRLASKWLTAGIVACACLMALPNSSRADVTFTGGSGNLSASVTFQCTGSTLTVTLTNTSASDVLVPADVLTAVFFDIAGSPTLTRDSAVVAAGSTVNAGASVGTGATDPGNGVGGEWAYESGISGPSSTDYGIFSAGFGFNGNLTFPNPAPGSNLQGPASVDGLQYGITSAGDNPSTGNSPLQNNSFIQNSVVFTLTGLPAGFVCTFPTINNVQFQYGTDLGSEPGFPGEPQNPVPEPASIVLFGVGMVGLGTYRFYRRKKLS